MIGKVNKLGTGFKGVARYLERGSPERVEPDRVDWIESRNLPTRDPEAAARIMAATARDGDSVQPPVYHFSISFDPADPVNRDTLRQVADRTLRDLGLQDHQALIVAHRDRAHPHVHVVVNRVHPEQHRVWSNWHDYRRIERSLRQQEAELGLRAVPGRHAPVPGHARTAPERAPARLERGDAAFVERVRREAGPHLTGARSWAELERGLAGHGLSVRVDGRGLVVTDGVRKAKASDIDRSVSRAHLERRLGALGEYRARQAVAARTLDDRAAALAQRRGPELALGPAVVPVSPSDRHGPRVSHTPERKPLDLSAALDRSPRAPSPQVRERTPAEPARSPVPARAPAERQRPRTYADAARDFSREARALYDDPAAARRAFLDASARRGAARTASTLRDEPHRFGTLRRDADLSRVSRAANAGYDYARMQGQRDRHVLKQSARLIGDAHRAQVPQRGLNAAANLAHVNVAGNVREAGARLASAAITRDAPELAAKLAERLVPMVPAQAVGLVKDALREGLKLARDMAMGRDPERERERSRGLSL